MKAPKGAGQQHPNPKPRAPDLSPSGAVPSQATSRSPIPPGHCGITRELEEGRQRRCWGSRTAGTTRVGMARGCLREHPPRSGAGNGPSSLLPFLPSREFPDLGDKQPPAPLLSPPQPVPGTVAPNPPTPRLAPCRATGLQHRGVPAGGTPGGFCRDLTHLITWQKAQPSRHASRPRSLSGAKSTSGPAPTCLHLHPHPWVGSREGLSTHTCSPSPAPPAANTPPEPALSPKPTPGFGLPRPSSAPCSGKLG